jgi:hypothetical protein
VPKLRITLKITHNNAALRQRLAAVKTTGLNRAADFLVGELQKVVSVPNTHRGNMHNRFAGSPPFQRTGAGMHSIRRTATGRISMLAYMAYLDLGTARIRPRPWYHTTIERLKTEITRRALEK